MVWLRSLAFNICFVVWTLLLGVSCAPLLVSRRTSRAVPFIWIRVSLWLLAVLCDLRYRVVGSEHRPQSAAIYASNHQSAWDTLALWYELNGPAFVLKKELLRIPVFGWYLWRSGQIAIDRSQGRSAMRQIEEQAAHFFAEGRNMVIFPEGTRVRYGQQKPYRGGVASLYANSDVPVIPVALNAGKFWGRNAFRKYPGVITLRYLPALPAGMTSQEVLPCLENVIRDAVKAMDN